MPEELDIAGFRVTIDGDRAVCRFAVLEDMGVDPPPDLEDVFRREVESGGRLAGKRVVFALDNMRAMSSRQLGSLLAIRKALEPEGLVPVRGIQPNVRELFGMTRMDQFFDY